MIRCIKIRIKRNMLNKIYNFYRYQIESIDTELSYPNNPAKCDPERDKDLLIERDKYINIIKVVSGIIDDIEKGFIQI